MTEPSLRTSRLALAGGLALALVAGGGGFLLGRGTSQRQVVATPPPPVAAAPVAPQSGKAQPVPDTLRRADLIALAAVATDAVAAGRTVPDDIVKAEGRRFEIRLPFGCQGSADKDSTAPMRWRYDDERKTLRIHVAPIAWTAGDWSPSAGEALDIETVEGFWVDRPWSSSDACPARGRTGAPGIYPVTLAGQTLALAQFFGAGDSRQGRRDGKAYDVVARVEPDALHADRGFRLRIIGKIGRVPGGAPVSCRQPAGSEQRPICVIATIVSEVAIENGQSGETLATWSIDHKER